MASTLKLSGTPVLDVLDRMNGWVNEFISIENRNIKGATPNPYIAAAIEVGLALGNVRNAYEYQGTLKLTTDKVDKTVNKVLTSLENMIKILQSRNTLAMQGVVLHAQEVVKSLNLADWQPQVTGVNPQYVIINKDGRFDVTFSGKFKRAAAYGTGYQLTCLNSKVHAERRAAMPDSISFTGTIGSHLLPDAASDNCRFIQGKLEVGYKNGYMPGALAWATFDIWFGVYPLNVGQITIVSNKIKTVSRLFASAKMYLDRADYPGAVSLERTVAIYPSQGWSIKKDPCPRLMLNGQFSDYLTANQFDEKHVDLTLKLPLGAVRNEVQVEFEETQEVIEEEEISQPLQLKWGEEYTVKNKPGEKFRGILFKSFDGQEMVFKGPDETKPYLKVRQFEEDFKLVAEAPK